MKRELYNALAVERTWEAVVTAYRPLNPWCIHGPGHWGRVRRNGRVLAVGAGADVLITDLFAVFHDSRRVSDGWDPSHGARGAEYAAELRGVTYDLPDEDFERLHYACTWHTEGKHHDDATIATCWDADRLDLGRVGVVPRPEFLSTALAKEIAGYESVDAFLTNATDLHGDFSFPADEPR